MRFNVKSLLFVCRRTLNHTKFWNGRHQIDPFQKPTWTYLILIIIPTALERNFSKYLWQTVNFMRLSVCQTYLKYFWAYKTRCISPACLFTVHNHNLQTKLSNNNTHVWVLGTAKWIIIYWIHQKLSVFRGLKN